MGGLVRNPVPREAARNPEGSSAGSSLLYSSANPHIDPLRALAQAREDGLSIHTMPPALTAAAAQELDVYTLTTARHPGGFWGTYRAHLTYLMVFNRLATNTDDIMRDAPDFTAAVQQGRLGQMLEELSQDVTQVDMRGRHVVDPKRSKRTGQLVGGTFGAESVSLTMADADKARLLLFALQRLLHKPNVPTQTTDRLQDASGQPTILEVDGYTEDDARSWNRIRFALWLRDLFRHASSRGEAVSWPYLNRTLEFFGSEAEEGVTVPPWLHQELEVRVERYEELAARRDDEAVPHTRLNIVDDPVDKRIRDAFNLGQGGIRDERGGQHRNREQARRKRRPSVEKGIDLRRKRSTAEEAAAGAPIAHRTHRWEAAQEQVGEALRYARQHPLAASWEGLTWLFEKAVSSSQDILLARIKYAPRVVLWGWRLGRDYVGWHRQEHRARLADQAFDARLSQAFADRSEAHQEHLAVINCQRVKAGQSPLALRSAHPTIWEPTTFEYPE